MRQRREGKASLVALLAAGLLPLGACEPASPPGPGPVVLVTIDTLPADRIGTYGNPSVRTPFLDRLARRGRLVRDAISPTPLTLPSHATLLTGLDPPRHGVRENGLFRLADSLDTVPELLPDGIETAAFVAAFPVAARFNLGQGFDRYDDERGPAKTRSQPAERRADEVFRLAGDWLAARPASGRPFVWVHAFDPHYPYDPPAPWPAVARATGGDAHAGEVAFTDRELGGFLRRIGALAAPARASVIVVADHGESLGRHGEITHSLFVYDATQRVPLILSGPGIAPALEARQRPLVDVAPTLLALYGVRADGKTMGGASLLAAPADEPAYVETKHTELLRGWSPLHGLRTARWKYIRAPRPELYDLEADPAEADDVHDQYPEEAARFDRLLESRLAAGGPDSQLPLDAEAAERLRALGYVATIEPGSGADPRKDPKDGVAGAAALFRGEEAFLAGSYVVAQRHLEQALALDPESKEAHSFLSGTLVGLHDYPGAIDHARRALELPPHLNEGPLHATLGEALLALGRAGEAVPHLRAALEARPRDAKVAGLLEQAEARAR